MSWFSSMSGTSGPGIERGGRRVAAGQMVARARESQYVRNVAMLVGGTALGQGVVVAASPVLTRLYAPSDFGVLAVFTAMVTVVVMVSALRFEVGIPLAPDTGVAANLLILSLLLVLGMGAAVSVLIWLAGDTIAGWVNAEVLRPYLWLLPVGVLGGGMYRVFNAWATRKEAFGPLSRTKLSQSLSMVTVQIGIGLFRATPIGLLLGWTAGQTGGTGTLAMLSWRLDRQAIRGVSLRGMRWAVARYRNLALSSSGSTLLNSLVSAFPAIFLGAVYGLGAAGSFALGQRVLAAPIDLIGGSMSQVYFGEAYRLKREDPSRLHGLFVKTIGRLVLIGVLPILIVALTSPWTFTLIFGPNWTEAGRFLQVLTPMLVIQFVYSGFGGTLEVLERKDLIVIAAVLRLVLMAGVVLVTTVVDVSALGAVALIGGAAFAGYLAYGVLCWRALTRGPFAQSPAPPSAA